MSKITFTEQSSTPTPLPSAGKRFIYMKSDGLHEVDSAGVDTLVGSGGIDVSRTAIYYVDKDRAAPSPTGDLDAPFVTIQDAIDAIPANGFGVVEVAYSVSTSGQYDEDLLIEAKTVHLHFHGDLNLGGGGPVRNVTLRGGVSSGGRLVSRPVGGNLPSVFYITGDIILDDTGGTLIGGAFDLDRTRVSGVSELPSYADVNMSYMRKCKVNNDLDSPNTDFGWIENTDVVGTATVRSFTRISESRFDSFVFSASVPYGHPDTIREGIYRTDFSTSFGWDGTGSADYTVDGTTYVDVPVDEYTFKTLGNSVVVSPATVVFSRVESGPNPIYGDGSAGSVTIAVDTTLSADTYYEDLVVNPGVVLHTGGHLLVVRGTLSLAGEISASGADGVLGGGGIRSWGRYPGEDGGSGTTVAGDTTTGGTGWGGTGGAGGAGSSGSGGSSGAIGSTGVAERLSQVWYILDAHMHDGTEIMGGSGGGGGGGDGSNSGGGGGGGGGVITLAARRILHGPSAMYRANGGTGAAGTGGNSGGGGGGGGGSVVLMAEQIVGAYSAQHIGGSGGAGAGTGSGGSSGASGSGLIGKYVY